MAFWIWYIIMVWLLLVCFSQTVMLALKFQSLKTEVTEFVKMNSRKHTQMEYDARLEALRNEVEDE